MCLPWPFISGGKGTQESFRSALEMMQESLPEGVSGNPQKTRIQLQDSEQTEKCKEVKAALEDTEKKVAGKGPPVVPIVVKKLAELVGKYDKKERFRFGRVLGPAFLGFIVVFSISCFQVQKEEEKLKNVQNIRLTTKKNETPIVSTRTLSRAPAFNKSWIVPDLGLEMSWIKPGSFMMGSEVREEGRSKDELQHEVRLTKGYWLGKYEVTQGEFRRFVEGENYETEAEKGDGVIQWTGATWEKKAGTSWRNSLAFGENYPVVGVSWNDALRFCRWLTKREQGAGRIPEGYEYSLPTEAQWEYACRAGTTWPYYTGGVESALSRAGWWQDNSDNKTHPVGQKQANHRGLYDMHGNVWEWCYDWKEDYTKGTAIDPAGPSTGSDRVLRGGSWYHNARYCRSAFRAGHTQSYRRSALGFRLALRVLNSGAESKRPPCSIF